MGVSVNRHASEVRGLRAVARRRLAHRLVRERRAVVVWPCRDSRPRARIHNGRSSVAAPCAIALTFVLILNLNDEPVGADVRLGLRLDARDPVVARLALDMDIPRLPVRPDSRGRAHRSASFNRSGSGHHSHPTHSSSVPLRLDADHVAGHEARHPTGGTLSTRMRAFARARRRTRPRPYH
jgi:hypothetical protein